MGVWMTGIGFCAGVLVAVLWFTMSGADGNVPGAAPEGGGSAQQAGGVPPAMVRLGDAKSQQLRQRTAVTGRLRELRRATVAAEVEGKVLNVPVQAGDRVVGGETVLAEIDGVWAKLDLKRSEADVSAARATLEQSKLDLKYLEQLQAANSAKPKEVDDKRAQVASDQASLDSAIAERDRVKREVDRLVVIAPFDGTVTEKLTEVGQWVAAGDSIAEVISQGQIDAEADVPERLIDHVHLSDVAEVSLDALGTAARGKVVAINPNGSNAARTYAVKARLDDQDGRLKPGMSVTVWLPVGDEQAFLTVPQDAVLYGTNGQTVWVAQAGEGPMPSAMMVPVKPLFAEQGRVAVQALDKAGTAMLGDGTRVVVEGAEALFPGQPLVDVDQTPPTKE